MIFRATFIAMAANEILEMILPYQLDDIKRRDPKPLFKAFVIGQEGKAEMEWVGIGKVVKTWFADAIGKISRLINPGMKLFHNHPEPGVDKERPQIGEVAGSRTKMVDGKFSAIIASYIYPEYKNLKLDIASIEADLNIDSGNINGDVHDINVENVSAVALGDSRVNSPGFPGATILGELQAFSTKRSHKINLNKGGDMPSISEVKDFIKTEKFDPSDLFGKDALLEDPVIKRALEDSGGNAYQQKERNRKEFEEAKEKWEKLDKEKDEMISSLRSEGASIKASDLFDTKLAGRKLDERATGYLKARKPKFKVVDPQKVEVEVDDFLDLHLITYKEDAKLFGIEEKDESENLIPGSEENEKGSPREADALMPG